MRSIDKALKELIAKAAVLGVHVHTAREFLEHREFGLCLDTIATQLYECEIAIDIETYDLVCKIAALMKEPAGKYSHLTVLLR